MTVVISLTPRREGIGIGQGGMPLAPAALSLGCAGTGVLSPRRCCVACGAFPNSPGVFLPDLAGHGGFGRGPVILAGPSQGDDRVAQARADVVDFFAHAQFVARQKCGRHPVGSAEFTP